MGSLQDSPHAEVLTGIIRDLERLATTPAALARFGAREHRFGMNDPVSEEEIAAFEAQYNIRLPSEYRDFFKFVGNGGAGPGYGLFRLGYEYLTRFDDTDCDVGVLSNPCPLTRKSAENLAWYDSYFDGLDDDEEDDCLKLDGAIPLCSHGCSHTEWLLITGDLAGSMCWWSMGGDDPPQPLDEMFLAWYRAWLDMCCEKIFDARPTVEDSPHADMIGSIIDDLAVLSAECNVLNRFELRDPIPEEDLAAFEDEYGIQLPREYRDFLRYAGGGVGPGIRFYSLRFGRHGPWQPGDGYVGDVQKPFEPRPAGLFRRLTTRLLGTHSARDVRGEAGVHGALPICGDNEAEVWLAVTGDHAGALYRIAWASKGGHAEPVEMGFMDWYRAWVDRVRSEPTDTGEGPMILYERFEAS